jgi:CsbD-like
MDKDRISGAAHQVKGAAKETVGKVTGDAKTQAEGAARKRQGRFNTLWAALRMPSGTRRRSDWVLPEDRRSKADITGRVRAPYYGRRKPWAEASCFGCWVYPFR